MDFLNSNNIKQKLRFSTKTGVKIVTREGASIEFKESFNWSSKDKYGKSIAAFANNKGGSIIFGIKDKPRELLGLSTTNFEETDEAKITQYLNSVFSPEIEFEKNVVQVRGHNVGIFSIKPAKKKPIIAIKNDGDIKEGEIYYRYIARSDRVKFPELRSILDQIQEAERKQWAEMFERISKIGPENAAVMDMVDGKIDGYGGTVVIDHRLLPKLRFIKSGSFQEKGKPVLKLVGDVKPISFVSSRRTLGGGFRITTDPSVPVMRLEEKNVLKEFSLDFSTLTSQLRERYLDFKSDNKYVTLRKDLMKKGFAITRKLNPSNPKSAQQNFYTPRIIEEFDKYYSKR